MATSINLRLNDELEKKLNDKVEEIKKESPTGAEANNSTFIRGALIDFFEKLDKKSLGEKNISFYPKQLSNEELKNTIRAFDDMIDNLDNFIDEEKAGHNFVYDMLTMISNELTMESLERRKRK